MRRVLPLFAVLCLAFAPAPFPRTQRQSAPALAPSMDGSWHSYRPMLIAAAHLTFGDASTPPYCRLALGRAVRPATFDLVHLQNGEAMWLGIYKVEADTLTIC